ncbi:MAG: transposase [Beijerinckiaceae bacterium]
MSDPTLPLPGLSAVAGGLLSSEGGVLAHREIEQSLHVAGRLAGCFEEPRDPKSDHDNLAAIIGFRLTMIGVGYEDGSDAREPRRDPVSKKGAWSRPFRSRSLFAIDHLAAVAGDTQQLRFECPASSLLAFQFGAKAIY